MLEENKANKGERDMVVAEGIVLDILNGDKGDDIVCSSISSP